MGLKQGRKACNKQASNMSTRAQTRASRVKSRGGCGGPTTCTHPDVSLPLILGPGDVVLYIHRYVMAFARDTAADRPAVCIGACVPCTYVYISICDGFR